jgi:uncharacterized protein (DUF305 family)
VSLKAEQDTAPETDVTSEPTQPAWVRPLVMGFAALALLMLGATAGVLLGLPGSAERAAPAADSVDVGFAQDMTVHHEQAVQMATWARDHTTDPQLRQLAYDIESGQSRQIGHMQGWLGLWGASALPNGPFMRWMPAEAHMSGTTSGHGSGHTSNAGVAKMPGMASEEELRQLRASSGTEMDVLFLQLMLRHHEGGVPMLEYAARHAQEAEVRNLARQMLTAQTNESEYMRRLLAQRGASPLPLR